MYARVAEYADWIHLLNIISLIIVEWETADLWLTPWNDIEWNLFISFFTSDYPLLIKLSYRFSFHIMLISIILNWFIFQRLSVIPFVLRLLTLIKYNYNIINHRKYLMIQIAWKILTENSNFEIWWSAPKRICFNHF